MLLETGKLGSLRDIELTDTRSVLYFLAEYHRYKGEGQSAKQYVYGDQTEFA